MKVTDIIYVFRNKNIEKKLNFHTNILHNHLITAVATSDHK